MGSPAGSECDASLPPTHISRDQRMLGVFCRLVNADEVACLLIRWIRRSLPLPLVRQRERPLRLRLPRSNSRSSTLRSDKGNRTYIITTRRMTSGDELNRRKGLGGLALDFRDMKRITTDGRALPRCFDRVHLAVQFDIHFIHVPSPVAKAPHSVQVLAPDVGCEHRAETIPPCRTVSWQISMPRSNSTSSTLRSDRGNRTYVSATRRMTSGKELKRRKELGGFALVFRVGVATTG